MWESLRRLDNAPGFEHNPQQVQMREKLGLPQNDEVWANVDYQVTVKYLVPISPGAPEGREGMMHLSIHRNDRAPIGDWRVMQQIKNEVAGTDREAVEIYPAERYLIDTSNEYHLWVLPVGAGLPFGFKEGAVTSDQQVERYNAAREEGLHKGCQQPWEEGLTTGRNDEAPVLTGKDEEDFYRTFEPDDGPGG
jgi:hypothetical protein